MHPRVAEASSNQAPQSSEDSAHPKAPTPVVQLFAGEVIVTRTCGLSCESEVRLAPLIALAFDYGGTVVPAGEWTELPVRDRTAEINARRLLERLGAVDLSCVDVAPPPERDADYVVRVDGDAHAFCAFTAEAVPQLRALGWKVEIEPRYPFEVAQKDVAWYVRLDPDDALPDWFSLELGVELDGARIDLLPVILEMIENATGNDLRDLERECRPSYALRVDERRHVTVASSRLKELVRVVLELYQGTKFKASGFPAARVGALDGLERSFARGGTRVVWHDPSGLAERARAIGKTPTIAPSPPTLRADLRPYQREGLAFLQHLRAVGMGGILADDMGLGKTLQTIAHFCEEKASGRMIHPCLVVAPTSLVGNWARELRKFAPHLEVLVLHGAGRKHAWKLVPKADVVITTYALTVRDEERFAKERFHLVVLDEAQALKNSRSQAHRALKHVHAEHRLCLTGTPVENHLGELWSIFDFVNPGLLGDELGFRRAWRRPIEEGGDELRMAALRELVAPFVKRRVKRDVAPELPPKTELLRPVELSGKQRELYEHIRVAAHAHVRRLVRARGLSSSTIAILDALLKLRQVCCDPRLVPMDSARAVRESAKFDALMQLVEEHLAQGHRALIFSQFTSMLSLIAEGLRARGIPHLSLTGATQNRQAMVDAFEEGRADIFLISLKAGGTGLNLTSADTVIHYDPWWNPAAQAQATDRAYRIGQKRPVFVYRMFAAGSVEERVIALQERKRWLASSLLGDDGGHSPWREDEIDELFAPLDEPSS